MSKILSTSELQNDKSILGFWIYLMSDLLIFASLFATFIVLRNNTAGGPSGAELFSLAYVYIETIFLLASSFTAGLALYYYKLKNISRTNLFLIITFALGLIFLTMEFTEFTMLVKEGNGWTSSAFSSAYFTLVGTHGLHILIGLIWLIFMILSITKNTYSIVNQKRIFMWSLFWHFLDIVWIFIFTIVYLLGAIE